MLFSSAVTAGITLTKMVPPPATIPSSTAALGGVQGVLDAELLLLHLGLGSSADLDDGHAAGELGKALLQLLLVVFAGGHTDLGANLRHAVSDGLLVAGTVDDGGVLLGDLDLAGTAEHVDRGILERRSQALRR